MADNYFIGRRHDGGVIFFGVDRNAEPEPMVGFYSANMEHIEFIATEGYEDVKLIAAHMLNDLLKQDTLLVFTEEDFLSIKAGNFDQEYEFTEIELDKKGAADV